MNVNWVFDPAPPSGKRTGGSAAEYSFEGRIDTLVRETVQNSLDARRDEERVEVKFRLVNLTGDSLETFLESIRWDSLEDNLRAVPQQRGGRAITNAVDMMKTEGALRLLVIEDRGTRGLEGAEQRESDDLKNSFCALVRDELYSDKANEDSGGSFGLGKSLLWAYSAVKTVLFASRPYSPPEDKYGIRFIGRASLPYHSTEEDEACTGDGWLGVRRGEGELKRRAESIWSGEAERLARKSHCPRPDGDFGLSTVIVDFSEPGEEDRDSVEVANSIVEAGLESFWPAITRHQLGISVTVEDNGHLVQELIAAPRQELEYGPLVELLHGFDNQELSEATSLDAGESALTWVTLDVPRRDEDPEHVAFSGKVALLVKLLEDSEADDSICDRVYRFRRPGMIVRSERTRNLSIAARPYVAIIVAGRACGNDPSYEKVERFLRAAEPPAHDQWSHNTREIKASYQEHGCRKKLRDFEAAILEAIRGLISIPEERGGVLPKAVLRHLRFGAKSGGGQPRFLSLTHTGATPSEGRWVFRARCRRVRTSDQPWFVTVRLKYAVDGGGADDVRAVDTVSSEDATQTIIRKGMGYLQFPADVDRSTIHGTTAADGLPSVGTRAAVQLRVDGSEGEIPNA